MCVALNAVRRTVHLIAVHGERMAEQSERERAANYEVYTTQIILLFSVVLLLIANEQTRWLNRPLHLLAERGD